MADENSLTPSQAALAANNVYYTLQGWVTGRPVKGKETDEIVEEQVVGTGLSTLRYQAMGRLGAPIAFEANTVFARTGFGYVLPFRKGGAEHVVLATRGTRPELPGKPDLLTDLYAVPTGVFHGKLVHKGFSDTFRSMNGVFDMDEIGNAQFIHCVGHSLGGAVANLTAYHAKSCHPDKTVKLYTFGAPRVGTWLGFPGSAESKLGKENIYRVSHDGDPITMIPTFPYLHILGSDSEDNNITLKGPAGPGSMKNHSMDGYVRDMRNRNWGGVRGLKRLPQWEDRLMKDLWEAEASGFFGKGWKVMKFVGYGIVWLLLKILKGLLKLLAGAVIVFIATPLDLIARLLWAGLQGLKNLGSAVFRWIRLAAGAVGSAISKATDVTTAFLRYLLERLWRLLRIAAENALESVENLGQMAYFPSVIPGLGFQPIVF